MLILAVYIRSSSAVFEIGEKIEGLKEYTKRSENVHKIEEN